MTVGDARELLEKPVFGNETHIEAVRLIEVAETLRELMNVDDKKFYSEGFTHPASCQCCEGTGTARCECCGEQVDCHRCESSEWPGILGMTKSQLLNCIAAEREKKAA